MVALGPLQTDFMVVVSHYLQLVHGQYLVTQCGCAVERGVLRRREYPERCHPLQLFSGVFLCELE